MATIDNIELDENPDYRVNDLELCKQNKQKHYLKF